MILPKDIHRKIFENSLILLAIAIPTSVFLMSVSQFIMYGNWILEGNFKQKWIKLKSNHYVWIFVSMYILHLIWLFPPQDYQYALNDLRIKLPWLLMPIVLSSSEAIDKKTLKTILLFFIASVTAVSFVVWYRWIFHEQLEITDYRNLSPFISHIRFSLMIILSIFTLFYFSINASKILRLLYIFGALYLILFIFILRSNTGIVLLFILSFLIGNYFLFTNKKIHFIVKILIVLTGLGFVLLIYKNVSGIWQSFIKGYYTEMPQQQVYSLSGNLYYFDPNNKEVENGQRVWFYVQEQELKQEWEKRSKIPYLGYTENNQLLKFILLRYLTSKGLKKDSSAIASLTNDDIKAIEKGIPNYLYTKRFSLKAQLYSFLWDYYNYRYLNDVNGRSFFQRIEYVKTAWYIIKHHFWLGVGTGNVKKSFDEAYSTLKSPLKPEFRLRAHNQFITFWLTFGIGGFIWFLFSFIYPFIKNKHYPSFIATIYFIITLISYLNEDTLETQAGLTFVIYFYSVFCFLKVHHFEN